MIVWCFFLSLDFLRKLGTVDGGLVFAPQPRGRFSWWSYIRTSLTSGVWTLEAHMICFLFHMSRGGVHLSPSQIPSPFFTSACYISSSLLFLTGAKALETPPGALLLRGVAPQREVLEERRTHLPSREEWSKCVRFWMAEIFECCK